MMGIPMTLRALLAAACLAAALPAQAYCIHNQLANREISVEQAPVKDKLREDRALSVRLGPGKTHCCRNLDCNPGGRSESVVTLWVTVLGEPEYTCSFAEGFRDLKVTGDGTVRVQHNPRHPRSSVPYIVRIRSGQKDLTGPSGLSCFPPPPATDPPPTKGKK
jgi:hypothetical protein